jgi:hypothetical protein
MGGFKRIAQSPAQESKGRHNETTLRITLKGHFYARKNYFSSSPGSHRAKSLQLMLGQVFGRVFISACP